MQNTVSRFNHKTQKKAQHKNQQRHKCVPFGEGRKKSIILLRLDSFSKKLESRHDKAQLHQKHPPHEELGLDLMGEHLTEGRKDIGDVMHYERKRKME